MSPSTNRILKEAHSLFWPWLAVVTAAALPLLESVSSVGSQSHHLWGIHQMIEPATFLGFFIGLPLLATLSLGKEFQHRTLALLLSQPIPRTQIWAEKTAVAFVAVLSAAFLFCVTARPALRHDAAIWILCGSLMIPMLASANFWTLVAGSTLGGLALNTVNSLAAVVWLNRRDWIPQTTAARSITALLVVSYAGAMLWLGRRKLAHFELTGSIAGDDLLMSAPGLMPRFVAGWLRPRPQGVLLNLLRKELRLLRPVWLLSLLAVPIWIVLPLFPHTSDRGSLPDLIMAVAFTPLIAVLSGSLPLGEEKTSGTHSWHLTLPVSAARQWFIKLATALFTSLTCAALLPILALNLSHSLFGAPVLLVDPDHWTNWALPIALLTFASFWCACTVNGTVRAALTVFPALIALGLAGRFGLWVTNGLVGLGAIDFLAAKFHLFANFSFTNFVANRPWLAIDLPSQLLLLLFLAPTLLFAVSQSRWLFHKLLQDHPLFLIRRLFPLAIIAFFSTFSLAAFDGFVFHAKREMWATFRETHEAIEKIQPGIAGPDESHPLQLTVEDLAKAAPLSVRTQRWLRDSRITVVPGQSGADSKSYCCGSNSSVVTYPADKPNSRYLATIRLPNGSACTISFVGTDGLGILGGVCSR
jgi:hypothetical protein